jgi:hypothetical protein
MNPHNRKEFAPEQLADIVRRFRGGESKKSIGKLYACSSKVITRVLSEKAAFQQPQIKMTRIKTRKAYAEVKSGISFKEVAKRYGVIQDTLKRAFVRYGLRKRAKPYTRPDNWREIEAVDQAMRRRTEAIVAALEARDEARWRNP